MSTVTTLEPPDAPAGSGATFRRWRGLDDIDGMVAANARLRARVGLVEPITAESMRHRYTHLVNSDPLSDCILVERDGETRGYARVEWHDLTAGDRILDATVVVEPSAWGLGLHEAMLRWSEGRSLEVLRDHPTDRPCAFAVYAFDGDDAMREALLALGYEPVRRDAEMLRPDLDDLPDAVLPPGYELRAPEPDELEAVHRTMTEGFAEHWGEAEAHEWRIEEWTEDPRFRRDLVVVAWHGSVPAAAVTNLLEPAPDGSQRGLLDAVVTHPAHRRLGLARACMAQSLRLLRDAGASAAYLGVDTGNHNRALTLYESCGFHVVSGGTTYHKSVPAPEDRP